MRKFLVKSQVLMFVLATIGLKASAPPQPTITTIYLFNIPSNIRDDYQIKYVFNGDGAGTSETIAYGPFNSGEYNNAGGMYYDDLAVTIYTKATSGSQWSYLGVANQEDGSCLFSEMGGIILFSLDFNDLYNP